MSTPPFRKFRRTALAEMRDLSDAETDPGALESAGVGVSDEGTVLYAEDPDLFAGGFVARDPDKHSDQWYVTPGYAERQFEEVTS